MKICWDNLENLKFTKNGNFRINGMGSTYYEYDACLECGDKHPMFGKGYLISGKNSYWFGKTGEKHHMFGKTGELHPAWIDGRSYNRNQYCTQWSDKEYKDWIVNERDGKCFGPECNGNHTHKLVPHHINYNKKDCIPINLIALCVSCNSKSNFDREWHEAYYAILMKKRINYNELFTTLSK